MPLQRNLLVDRRAVVRWWRGLQGVKVKPLSGVPRYSGPIRSGSARSSGNDSGSCSGGGGHGYWVQAAQHRCVHGDACRVERARAVRDPPTLPGLDRGHNVRHRRGSTLSQFLLFPSLFFSHPRLIFAFTTKFPFWQSLAL